MFTIIRASRLSRTVLASLVLGAAAPACKSADEGGGPTTTDGAAAGDSGGAAIGTLETFAFKPSNLPLGAGPTKSIGDVSLTGRCVIDGEDGTIECPGGTITGAFWYGLLEQTDPDHTKVAAFFVRNLRLETGADVSVEGPHPVALVAWDTARINGAISATVDHIYSEEANGGGFSAKNAVGPGAGPGAGGGPSLADKLGAGGAGYCGRGGPGGAAAGPGSNGGKSYGNEIISPLLGGSSGGSNDFAEGAGGGGALQIIAGSSIDVGTTGVLSAAGGGGSSLGGGGAGSGGAVLLEATTVRMAGTIAVNGGGGGGNTLSDSGVGENGRADATAAKGGAADNLGGDGSAAAMIDGSAGAYKGGAGGGVTNTGGGGGGGAGRIRINTASGAADVTGTLSPSSGPCAQIGKLAM